MYIVRSDKYAGHVYWTGHNWTMYRFAAKRYSDPVQCQYDADVLGAEIDR